MVLLCNRFIMLFTERTHQKNKQKLQHFKFYPYNTLKGTVVEYNSWHTDGLASSEQARSLTGERRGQQEEEGEGRDEDCQQQGTEARLQLHQRWQNARSHL